MRNVICQHEILASGSRSLAKGRHAIRRTCAALELDIGIGSGALARKLADRGAQITGIDLSDRMLALCRKHNPDFELCGGTFNNIPFPAATFGEMVGFLGPNGAGKATALKMLTGLLHPNIGATVILTSHYMADVAELCPRVLLIHHGRRECVVPRGPAAVRQRVELGGE